MSEAGALPMRCSTAITATTITATITANTPQAARSGALQPAGDYVGSSPALSRDGKVAYVGIFESSLYAVDAVNGSKIWSFCK